MSKVIKCTVNVNKHEVVIYIKKGEYEKVSLGPTPHFNNKPIIERIVIDDTNEFELEKIDKMPNYWFMNSHEDKDIYTLRIFNPYAKNIADILGKKLDDKTLVIVLPTDIKEQISQDMKNCKTL